MLSEENMKRIQNGENPVFDDDWIKVFPFDERYRGEVIPLQDVELHEPESSCDEH